jgi:hypothetical protein
VTKLAWMAPIVFIAVMLGGVGVAQATGTWITSGKQVVAAAGQLAVEDVKGSMTLQQAADGLAVPYPELVSLIKPPDRNALTRATLFKDLEALVPGFSLTTFRETLRSYLAAESGSTLPSPSMSAPPARPTPSRAATTVQTSTRTHTASAVPTGTGTGDASIKGSMTLHQVADADRLTLSLLVAECGLPADVNTDLTLRELADATPGFDVQVVKDAVARLT